MLTDKTIALIQQMGFTAYEAKAYLGLLSCQPASAYEVAKRSTVPTSKIYETLNKLVSKGVVQPTSSETKQSSGKRGQHYVALSPEDFSRQIQETALSQTRELLPLLELVHDSPGGDYIWPLTTRGQIVAKASEMIRQTRSSLLVSCWPEELSWLEQDLREAENQGAKIALVHFGPPTQTIGATYHHPVEKTLYEEKGGRGLTLVADSQVVLIANFRKIGSIDAAWSKTQAFVTVAEDYIKHDVYITKVTRFLNKEMLARFGANYEKLRDVFNAEA
ncbi:MAG TPA: TrmB family transcriptional regulator [Gammaproteobacteria bacterium]|nr:TrmB family transcriptional regulator [Gammaproteobacteria bacterium]HIL99202.1 TrmB family transcriptional regulator [Pseudomonadales bacterium]